ncbi:MAG: flagellar biosynthetic protein FliP, partial [Rhodocyclaceae bacterium]
MFRAEVSMPSIPLRHFGLLLVALGGLLLPMLAQAQALPALTTSPAAGGGQTYSVSVQTLLLL